MVSKELAELSGPSSPEAFGAIASSPLATPGLVGGIALAESPLSNEGLPLRESLRKSFNIAFENYIDFSGLVNEFRASLQGPSQPEQLKIYNKNTVRAQVEAILANDLVIKELQADIDYFRQYPEIWSPQAGFDTLIVPRGLSTADVEAMAYVIQAKIPSNRSTPFIRPKKYNEKQVTVNPDQGVDIVFWPCHLNVPEDTAAQQTLWMKSKNQSTAATKLRTVTDADAEARINGLANKGKLKPNHYHNSNLTLSRRFDEPEADRVPAVVVFKRGLLSLNLSHIMASHSSRALVVPILAP